LLVVALSSFSTPENKFIPEKTFLKMFFQLKMVIFSLPEGSFPDMGHGSKL